MCEPIQRATGLFHAVSDRGSERIEATEFNKVGLQFLAPLRECFHLTGSNLENKWDRTVQLRCVVLRSVIEFLPNCAGAYHKVEPLWNEGFSSGWQVVAMDAGGHKFKLKHYAPVVSIDACRLI